MFITEIGATAGLLLGAAIAASPVQASDNYILGRCSVSTPISSAEISPTLDGDGYLVYYHNGDQRYQGFTFDVDSAKVTLVKTPAHGIVEHVDSNVSNNQYKYKSNESYYGKDRFVMQVEKNGVKVRIQYLIDVVLEDEPTGNLCIPDSWKISFTIPTLDNARLQALLGAANINNNVSVTFSKSTKSTGSSLAM